MDFKTLKNRIKWILETYPDTKDNDKTLCWKYWSHFEFQDDINYGYYGDNTNTIKLTMSFHEYQLCTSESSITRARRQLQRFHPELRGSEYNKRKNIREPEWKDKMLDDKWNEIDEINKNRKNNK